MTTNEKQAIADKLREYCELKGSQGKAATSMTGVSSAIISLMLSGKWESISDEMWRNVAAQIGQDKRQWVVVETEGYRRIYDLLTSSQNDSLVFAVIGDAGCGKSEAIKSYAANNRNVYNLSCSEYWNRKHFMTELLQCMSLDSTGSTVPEMMSDIIYALKKRENPLIVLDEADKLSDQVLYFFISLYNKLEDHVGIMLCATDYLEKRIKKGVRMNRKGYKEIYSRVGRKFIPMPVVNDDVIGDVCRANGIDDKRTISNIINDCDCDLRRVKRLVYAVKQLATTN